MQSTKECRQQLIQPDFETHGQCHPKSQTEGTSGPTKKTSVQQKLLKKEKKTFVLFDLFDLFGL